MGDTAVMGENSGVRVAILGTVEVSASGQAVEVGGARLRALLTLLALEAGRPVPAERIIADLWEDRVPAAAPNALQSLVSRLRAVIGAERVESRNGTYRLVVPREAVDAHDFEARLLDARRRPDAASRSAALLGALGLWRGPALADASGLAFASGPAARLEGLRRTALEDRIDADLSLGRHIELIPELEALAAADPLREPLRGRLMRALYAAGRQADALAEYTALKDDLAEALGVDPGPDLERLYLAILRQDPGLLPSGTRPAATETVAERSVAAPLGNLRARLTSFIGRDDDLTQVRKLLGGERLVTLTGPGGAGKTRLAQESGERLLAGAPDGVWFIELAPVTDPGEVANTVLTALGLREVALTTSTRGRAVVAQAGDPLERLASALASRRPLLILDNCEHLLDAAARLADHVLAGCPGVRILATSREPLGITGETLWPVEPLEPPPLDAGAAEAMAYPAVRLFADRAAAVSPGFAVTERSAARVVQICRALDGMPLAIELAAARLRSMTPAQVAARLGDRFRLLNAGSRTALPRHQTLRAVVDWSWDLLDEAERALWRRLAVFRGGATLASAEEVCAGPELARGDVLDVLTALVDKSLAVITGAEDEHGPRYRMLETIRAYGLARLAEAGEEERALRAHATYFVGLAEAAEPHLYRHEQLDWLARLVPEQDNIHLALRWAVSVEDAPLAVRFCAALGWYWFLRGQLGEGADQLASVLTLPGLPADQTTAVALAAGAMTSLDSQREGGHLGREWLLRARDICAELPDRSLHPLLRLMQATIEMYVTGWDENGLALVDPLLVDEDPWVRGVGYFIHGQLAANFGWTEHLENDFDAALGCFREAGDRWGLSFTLTAQAEVLGSRGDHHGSVALFEEALGLTEALGGGAVTVLQIYMRLGNELALIGKRDRAVSLLNFALSDAERTASSEGMAVMHYQLGQLARRDGDYAEALRRLARAEELGARPAGPPECLSMIRTARAQLDLALGDPASCRTWLEQALRGAVQSLDFPMTAYALAGHAALALHENDPERAAELLGTAHTLRGGRDLSMPDVTAIEETTTATLGTDTFTTAYDRGRTRTFDDVLTEFALERPNPASLIAAAGPDRRGTTHPAPEAAPAPRP